MKAFLFLLVILVQSAIAADLLNYKTVVNLADHKGTPFFEVMRKSIKPKLDTYAIEGFTLCGSKTVSEVLRNVSDKVKRKATKGISEEALLELADTLSKSKKKITFYDLPEKLSSTPGFKGDRYGLTTFFALACGGGVAVKMSDDVYAYNVNYGSGEIDKDEMTGRSFGAVGTFHKADDASDAAYLTALEKISRPSKADAGKEIAAFSRSVLDIVINSDVSSMSKLSNPAKALMSDFVAVYTAEQDRHLMANLESHHWDSALLEVTLLANFHAGQKKMAMYFERTQNNFEFTSVVPDQNLARKEDFTGEIDRDAAMVDYWQFSKNPANPNRSGINLTRKSFSKLEKAITEYERKNNPNLVKAVETQLTGIKLTGNLFDNLSDFLINFQTQKDVKKNSKALINAYMAFLNQVRLDANTITKELK